jgi:hypothetical protein
MALKGAISPHIYAKQQKVKAQAMSAEAPAKRKSES